MNPQDQGNALEGIKTDTTPSKRDRIRPFKSEPESPAVEQAGRDTIGSLSLTLSEAFESATIPSTQLGSIGILPRSQLLGDWFYEADLVFVYARRGLGKTWFSLGLACAIAGKRQFGPWRVHSNAPVLYIDGEMPVETIHERLQGLGVFETLTVLNHETLFHKSEGRAVLNLTSREAQNELTQLCLRHSIKVLFLDNLSCLFSGVNENEADAWEAVLPWLLELRRHRIAVVIVAHSGRDGKNMRGTSRREDAAFAVIRLDDPPESTEPKNGARFRLRFTKDRNSASEQVVREWTFQTMSDGAVDIDTREADGLEMVVQWVKDGLTSATDIAAEMGVSKGKVSKMARALMDQERLRKNGRDYALPL
jgi:hypothetical protein